MQLAPASRLSKGRSQGRFSTGFAKGKNSTPLINRDKKTTAIQKYMMEKMGELDIEDGETIPYNQVSCNILNKSKIPTFSKKRSFNGNTNKSFDLTRESTSQAKIKEYLNQRLYGLDNENEYSNLKNTTTNSTVSKDYSSFKGGKGKSKMSENENLNVRTLMPKPCLPSQFNQISGNSSNFESENILFEETGEVMGANVISDSTRSKLMKLKNIFFELAKNEKNHSVLAEELKKLLGGVEEHHTLNSEPSSIQQENLLLKQEIEKYDEYYKSIEGENIQLKEYIDEKSSELENLQTNLIHLQSELKLIKNREKNNNSTTPEVTNQADYDFSKDSINRYEIDDLSSIGDCYEDTPSQLENTPATLHNIYQKPSLAKPDKTSSDLRKTQKINPVPSNKRNTKKAR